ncbi:MAG: hypothetical protein LUG86_10100 [Oscillospiraceae bacterium]|nr:hypothetical protein [Oscillospiraceae bacterium]
MLSFRILKTDLHIGFGFLLVTAVSFLEPNGVTGICLLFCFAHELGHLIAMKLTGAEVTGIRLYGGGIGISAETEELGKSARLLIYSAGCLTNITLALILKDRINFTIALFNLMPVSYFDGGMILRLLLPDSEKPLEIVSKVTICVLILAFFASVMTVPASISLSQTMTLFAIIASELIDREL